MSGREHPVSDEVLMAFVDGELHPEEVATVAKHVDVCPQCAASVEGARQVSRQMSVWKVEEAPERISSRFGEVTPKPSATWWPYGHGWAFGFAGSLVALFVLFTLTVPSLLRSRESAREVSFQAPAAAVGGASRQVPADPAPSPMVIRNIKVTMITKEFDAARMRLDAIVKQAQGYVDHLTVRADPGSARALSAVLRFPANQVASGLAELKKLGRLTEESQNSSDITGQYVDLAARLTNARNSEQRLLGLLRDRAGNLKDVVEMEREISSVRESIERMDAQQKDLNNKVQYATIQFELSEEYHAQLEPPAPSSGTQLKNALVDGIQSARENALDIALFLLRYGPALLIWLIVLGSLAAGLWWLRKIRFNV